MRSISNFQFPIFKRDAFTLAELLIAIAVFSIVVAIGVGGFVRALHVQREISALIETQSNASIALEQMAREIRTGYLFCDTPGVTPAIPNEACQLTGENDVNGQPIGCSVNGSVWTCNDILDFFNASGQNVDYKLVGGALERSDTGPGGQFSPITGDAVNNTSLIFTIFGNTEGDHWPPRITISLGIAPSSTDPALAGDVLNLQTTISAREIDCTQTNPVSC